MIQNLMPRIRLMKPEDYAPLVECAKADDHVVLAPNYVIEKGQQMVGYIGVIPCVMTWMDTQRMKVRDSAMVLNFLENQLAAGGSNLIAIPCLKTSNFHPFLPSVGYVKCEGTEVFMRNIQQ